MKRNWLACVAAVAAVVAALAGCGAGGGGNSSGDNGGVTVAPPPTAPTITTQPGSVAVAAGQTAAFTVTATGTAPLAYQWSRDGAAIAGATSASYTTAATTTTDSGAAFTVRVSNAAGAVTSNAAALTVTAPAPAAPAITTQPASQTVVAGQPATFAVTATGNAVTYQWFRGGAAISGATAASYTLSATLLADSGSTYTVRVANTGGQVDSTSATLTVTNPPAAATPTEVRLSAGPGYTIARLADGSVISWGNAMAGGSGPNLPGSNAHRVSGLANIVAVSAYTDTAVGTPNSGDSAQHNLAIANDGTVFGWGYDLGFITEHPSNQLIDTPVAISRLGASTAVAPCRILTFALHADGTVWFTPGTFNVGLSGFANAKQVIGLEGVAAFAEMHVALCTTLVTKTDGTVWRMDGRRTNTGPGEFDQTVTARHAGLTNIAQVSCSGIDNSTPGVVNTFYCLAATNDGHVLSWGNNQAGQLGDGTRTDHSTPAQVAGLTDVRQVVAASGASFARTSDGHVFSWGGYGDFGAPLSARVASNNNGLDPTLLVPGVIPSLTEVVLLSSTGGDVSDALRTNGVHVATLKRDGSVWTWGANCCGQLGLANSSGPVGTPVQVPGVNLN